MPRRLAQELKDKKIIITGGRGFLGCYLFPQIKRICKQVSLYEGDVRDIGSFSKHYDIVYHLAAINKVDSAGNAGLLFDTNVNGTLSVMRYCLRNGAKCIFASSAAVYKPTNQKRRLTEHSLIKPVSLYGVSKMLAENICEYYAKNFGVPVVSLRIFNMYGPGQAIPFLIPDIMLQLSRNKPILLRSPQVVRDFVYISDVVNAFILSCIFKFKGFQVLNIGSGIGVSVYSLVNKLFSQMGLKGKINKNISNNFKKDYVIADLSNIIKTLKWKPEVPLDKGLAGAAHSFTIN